jgi:nucleotide-binding universal stress UspA family protein
MSVPVVVGFGGSARARSAVHYGAREALRALVLGSTSRNVIEHAPCPMMVVPAAHDVV